MAKSTKTATPAKKPSVGPGGTRQKPQPKPAKPPAKPAPKAVAKSLPKPSPKAGEKKTSPVAAAKSGKKPDLSAGKAPAKADSKAALAPRNAGAAAPAGGSAPGASKDAGAGKVAPKGITIVQRPLRKPKPKKLEMPISEPLLKPGGKWKPLIPSGPKAPPTGLVGQGETAPDAALFNKNRLSKKELEKYREILLVKRAELVGDISNIEDEALRQNSGSLSSLPQHMAEQGSDTFEQSISLDLAQVDRNLIREIDEALQRIEAGTYGICLRTGQRISAERLAEIPWAKYSIEAQRDLERRPYRHAE